MANFQFSHVAAATYKSPAQQQEDYSNEQETDAAPEQLNTQNLRECSKAAFQTHEIEQYKINNPFFNNIKSKPDFDDPAFRGFEEKSANTTSRDATLELVVRACLQNQSGSKKKFKDIQKYLPTAERRDLLVSETLYGGTVVPKDAGGQASWKFWVKNNFQSFIGIDNKTPVIPQKVQIRTEKTKKEKEKIIQVDNTQQIAFRPDFLYDIFSSKRFMVLNDLAQTEKPVHGPFLCPPVTPLEDIYTHLVLAHTLMGTHSGRDKTYEHLTKYFSTSIPKELVADFIRACPKCHPKQFGIAHTTTNAPAEPAKGRKRAMRAHDDISQPAKRMRADSKPAQHAASIPLDSYLSGNNYAAVPAPVQQYLDNKHDNYAEQVPYLPVNCPIQMALRHIEAQLLPAAPIPAPAQIATAPSIFPIEIDNNATITEFTATDNHSNFDVMLPLDSSPENYISKAHLVDNAPIVESIAIAEYSDQDAPFEVISPEEEASMTAPTQNNDNTTIAESTVIYNLFNPHGISETDWPTNYLPLADSVQTNDNAPIAEIPDGWSPYTYGDNIGSWNALDEESLGRIFSILPNNCVIPTFGGARYN